MSEWTPLPFVEIPAHSRAALSLDQSFKQLAATAIGSSGKVCLQEPFQIFLEVRAVLRDKASWAPAGHVIACTQIDLDLDLLFDSDVLLNGSAEVQRVAMEGLQVVSSTPTASMPETPLAVLHNERADVEVASAAGAAESTGRGGGGFRCVISRDSGCIVAYEQDGRPMLQTPLEPCFFRAATDNDRGGSGGASYAARWLAAGLDRMAPVPDSCTLEVERRADTGSVVVKASWTMRPSSAQGVELVQTGGAGVSEMGGAHWYSQEGEPDAASSSSSGAAAAAAPSDPRDSEGQIAISVVYTITNLRRVHMRWEIDATDALPATLAPGLLKSLPRIGLRTALPSGLGTVSWYGRGPHECYCDRKHSAHVRRYQKPVDQLHVPYVFPQECGGRTDCRWLALEPSDPAETTAPAGSQDLSSLGVAFLAPPTSQLLQFSASRCVRSCGQLALRISLFDDEMQHFHGFESKILERID